MNYFRDYFDYYYFYSDEMKIMNESIKKFESNVKYLLQHFTVDYKYFHEKSNFSLFEPVNKNFYDMLTLEKRMETYIRDVLVLDTIHNLFKLYNIKYLWPYDYVVLEAIGITAQYPIAFIIYDNKYKIGYRLSDDWNGYEADKMKEYIKHYNIHHIEIIRFDEKIKGRKYDKSEFGVPMQEITFRDFFNRYFSLKNFDNYIMNCKEKIKWANNYLGFHTISSWTSRTNYMTRIMIINVLNEKLNNGDVMMKYKKITETNRFYGDFDLKKEEIIEIKHRVKENKIFDLLLSNNDCAQSIISSEYLYNAIISESNISAIQLSNFGFDFTVIACGYLKSIEQLLFIIFDMYTKTHNNEYYVADNYKYTEIIPGLKYDGKNDCKVRKEIRSDKLPDLGNLIYFMHLNVYKHFFNKSIEDKLFVQLLQFSQECRNGYFHKDNIEKLNILKDVRNNAYYLLTMILAGYDFESINIYYKNYFKPHNFNYDKLYLELYKHSKYVKKFSVLFENKIIDVHINDKLPEPLFDENGFLLYKKIIFYTDIDNSPINIDETCIPKKIWFRKYGKEKERVEIF